MWCCLRGKVIHKRPGDREKRNRKKVKERVSKKKGRAKKEDGLLVRYHQYEFVKFHQFENQYLFVE
jgi:hypothetical protein